MNPWIVRGILAVLALEAGICVAFLAEAWQPLRHREEALFETILTATRKDERFVVDRSDPVSRVRFVRPLEEGRIRPYLHVSIDEESGNVLESLPPSPLDWHLLLKHMHAVGCGVAAVEPPMSWEGNDLYHLATLATLDRSLALFDIAVLTVDLQRLPTPRPIPGYLKSSAIPIEKVRGDPGSLVRVNRVIHAPSATAAPNIRFSFRIQESVDEVVPEFVRWGDHLIPSFPLAVAMAQHRVAPAEVTIELGRHVRLGDGPIIPIDEVGQLDWARMELIDQPDRADVPAHLAVLESEIPELRNAAKAAAPRCALFTDARAGNTTPWPDHDQLQRLVSSFDALPHPGPAEPHRRFPIWAEVVFLVLISALAALVTGCRGLTRGLSLALLAIGVGALLVTFFVASHQWTPIAPILATAAVGWLLSIRMARYLPPADRPTPTAN